MLPSLCRGRTVDFKVWFTDTRAIVTGMGEWLAIVEAYDALNTFGPT